MDTLKLFFNRRWWWTTLLVIAAVGVAIRLGIWQVDRLGQRRAFNAETLQRLHAEPLKLNDGLPSGVDFETLKYRAVVVRGVYDPSQTLALKNQMWQQQAGLDMITPLIIEGREEAVLINRGWLPQSETNLDRWAKFELPSGVVEVRGWIRLTDVINGVEAKAASPDRTWFRMDIDQIQKGFTRRLMPIYIEQSPEKSWTTMPYRRALDEGLDDGPHIGYAITWFTLAIFLSAGYWRYVIHYSTPRLRAAQGVI
ncbi:MAG: SURF1 family protein [Chloroflexi bacterium]|nr:SURF1 family protein [Chloroflexota bacterium]